MMNSQFRQLWLAITVVGVVSLAACDDSETMDEMEDSSADTDTVSDSGNDTSSDSTMGTDSTGDTMMETSFRITIENISDALPLAASGVFAVPDGMEVASPAFSGDRYIFSFYAAMPEKLSFATMFVHSNDWIISTPADGIALFDDAGVPLTGDITSMLGLYDVGTEVNQPLGEGADQPVHGGPAVGEPDDDMMVRQIETGMGVPEVNSIVDVMLSYDDGMFTLTLENISSETTLELSDMSTTQVPISPGVYAVHMEGEYPLFMESAPDKGNGLEMLAEDGDPAPLATSLGMMTGPGGPVSPGVWVVHESNMHPLFNTHQPARSEGLEELAENGDPSVLSTYLMSMAYQSGIFDVPDGMDAPAPLFAGETYSFRFTATPTDSLSIAAMWVKSNDLFLAPEDMGIPLFEGGIPLEGDISSRFYIWDAGTEVNEAPGYGPNQPLNQTDATTGMDEMGHVMMVNDGFSYPNVNQLIRVTLTVE